MENVNKSQKINNLENSDENFEIVEEIINLKRTKNIKNKKLFYSLNTNTNSNSNLNTKENNNNQQKQTSDRLNKTKKIKTVHVDLTKLESLPQIREKEKEKSYNVKTPSSKKNDLKLENSINISIISQNLFSEKAKKIRSIFPVKECSFNIDSPKKCIKFGIYTPDNLKISNKKRIIKNDKIKKIHFYYRGKRILYENNNNHFLDNKKAISNEMCLNNYALNKCGKIIFIAGNETPYNNMCFYNNI